MQFGRPIFDFRCLILFGISLLLNQNKMMNACISPPSLFLFFLKRADFLKSCIKQSQSYLKSKTKTKKLTLIRKSYFIQHLQWCYKSYTSLKAVSYLEMMINCFCGMVDQQNGFSLIFSRHHCQWSLPLRISDTPRAGFEPAQNLSSGFVEWSGAVVITTTPFTDALYLRYS